MTNAVLNVDELTQLGWSRREVSVLSSAIQDGVRPISTTLADQMFQLFLEGYTCREILKVNPSFQEKDILYLRWKQQWDLKRQEHVKNLMQRVHQKLLKSKLESADFLSTLLSAIHKQYGDSLMRFLQTGNKEDLPELPSLKQYKEIVEILAKVTGEDRKVKIEGQLNHSVSVGSESQLDEIQSDFLKYLASKQAGSDTES